MYCLMIGLILFLGCCMLGTRRFRWSEFSVILDNQEPNRLLRQLYKGIKISLEEWSLLYVDFPSEMIKDIEKQKSKQNKTKDRIIPSPPSPTGDFLFFVLTHSHGHYCSTGMGTSCKKMAAIWRCHIVFQNCPFYSLKSKTFWEIPCFLER